jgi:hypothetical protein
MGKDLYIDKITKQVCEVIDHKVAGMGDELWGTTLKLYKTLGDDTLKVMSYQEFERNFSKYVK